MVKLLHMFKWNSFTVLCFSELYRTLVSYWFWSLKGAFGCDSNREKGCEYVDKIITELMTDTREILQSTCVRIMIEACGIRDKVGRNLFDSYLAGSTHAKYIWHRAVVAHASCGIDYTGSEAGFDILD